MNTIPKAIAKTIEFACEVACADVAELAAAVAELDAFVSLVDAAEAELLALVADVEAEDALDAAAV